MTTPPKILRNRAFSRIYAVLALAVIALPPAAADNDAAFPQNAPEKLVVIDLEAGAGEELLRGSFAVVHYDGWIWDNAAADHKGRRFDSSRERGAPLSLFYSPGRMIEGWYRGLKGMKSGGRRILVVPPALGYGKRNAFGEIPPDSTLIFEIELIDVVPRQNI